MSITLVVIIGKIKMDFLSISFYKFSIITITVYKVFTIVHT